MKLKLIFLLLIVLPVTLLAAEKQPICSQSGFRFSHDQLVFFPKPHSVMAGLYVIKNTSHQSLWILRAMKHNPGVSAGWASELAPGRSSTILLTRRPVKFTMQCQLQEKTGRAVNVSCKKVLHACQFERYVSHKPITSSYWVAENLSYQAMMKRLHARGFAFPAK